ALKRLYVQINREARISERIVTQSDRREESIQEDNYGLNEEEGEEDEDNYEYVIIIKNYVLYCYQ
ncbi:MAG: hypothetical protein EZS28_004405, partial [Streblomastix strix]